jgi:hypothetical protein
MTKLSHLMMIGWFALMPLLALAFVAAPVHAVDIGEGLSDVGSEADLSDAELPDVIGTLIGIFLSILGIIFLLLVLYAGFLWMTAAGNETQVGKAKKILTSVVIGAIIIFGAFAISAALLAALAGESIFSG